MLHKHLIINSGLPILADAKGATTSCTRDLWAGRLWLSFFFLLILMGCLVVVLFIWAMEKKGPWLFKVYREWDLRRYIGIIVNHHKDPYWTTRIQWKVRGFFSWLLWRGMEGHVMFLNCSLWMVSSWTHTLLCITLGEPRPGGWCFFSRESSQNGRKKNKYIYTEKWHLHLRFDRILCPDLHHFGGILF